MPEELGIDYKRRNVKPRQLTDAERSRLEEFIDSIHYSSRYFFSIRMSAVD